MGYSEEEDLDELRRDYLAYSEHVCNLARKEVIRGRGVEYANDRSPRDGALAFGAFFHVDSYLREKPRGRAFRPSPAFLLCGDPFTIRIPDVSFIESHRLAQYEWAGLRPFPVAPDLIIEVLTDSDREGEVGERIDDFFAAGTRIAWILDGRDDTLTMRRAHGETRVFRDNAKVLCAPVLPHLNLRVYELFGG